MTDNDKNKTPADSWDPTEYEIYLSDENENTQEPHAENAPVTQAPPEKKPKKQNVMLF